MFVVFQRYFGLFYVKLNIGGKVGNYQDIWQLKDLVSEPGSTLPLTRQLTSGQPLLIGWRSAWFRVANYISIGIQPWRFPDIPIRLGNVCRSGKRQSEASIIISQTYVYWILNKQLQRNTVLSSTQGYQNTSYQPYNTVQVP